MSKSISQGKTIETEAYEGSNISSVLLAGIFDVSGVDWSERERERGVGSGVQCEGKWG